jgi:hypothetical protein
MKQMRPNPMRPSISIQAKTWLRMEMSASVEPVAISFGSSLSSVIVPLLRLHRRRARRWLRQR